jgi:hypothetical protein
MTLSAVKKRVARLERSVEPPPHYRIESHVVDPESREVISILDWQTGAWTHLTDDRLEKELSR